MTSEQRSSQGDLSEIAKFSHSQLYAKCSTAVDDSETLSIPGTPDPFELYTLPNTGFRDPEPPVTAIRSVSAPQHITISLAEELSIPEKPKLVKVVSLVELLGNYSGAEESS